MAGISSEGQSVDGSLVISVDLPFRTSHDGFHSGKTEQESLRPGHYQSRRTVSNVPPSSFRQASNSVAEVQSRWAGSSPSRPPLQINNSTSGTTRSAHSSSHTNSRRGRPS